MSGTLATLLLAVAVAAPAAAQGRLRVPGRELTKAGDEVRGAFKEATRAAGASTLVVRSAGKDVALGTVVDASGLILTKYSELEGGGIAVRTPVGNERLAEVVGVDDEHDLALLKIDARGLVLRPVKFADAKAVTVGQFVASSAAQTDVPIAVGVVSVGRRKIAPRDGILGVTLEEADGAGAKVMQVAPGSGAEKAGIQVNDVITALNGREVKNREELREAIGSHRVGSEITVKLRRGDQLVELAATLGKRPGDQASRSDAMNAMGGPLSTRSSGFPVVLQHDTVLKPNECGGPLVTLAGEVIGINIARGGRTESYAIPSDVVVGLLKELRTGKKAPPSGSPATRPATRPAATRPSDDDKVRDRLRNG